MRKAICVLLCAIFLTAPVLASDVDLSGYSVEELLELQDKVNDALFEKGGLTVLSPGTYNVGIDIAPGTYVVKPHPTEDSGYIRYSVYKSEEAKVKYGNAYNKYDAAYSNALDRDLAGETADWPREVNKNKYMSSYGEISRDNAKGEKISLKDGEILEINCAWAEVPMTIEKSGGLFMD